ncbi:hypothetical protein CJ030_MR8G007354 [Morella rubra]|uniref:Uncharacterized protein n=1 Tax=Morella rubra TaxID=262757 RepID=A0A6A1UTK0_9ROSI|nr:hypothetical protein CJ030_MR8G007354 [Morella rubra]
MQVSINEKGVTKLSEWSFKSFSSIQMGKFGVVWMVNMIDKLMEAGVGNVSICPEVSFVVAVRASSSVIADEEKVCDFQLKAKKVVTKAHSLVASFENNMGSKEGVFDLPSRFGGGSKNGLESGFDVARVSEHLVPLFSQPTVVGLLAKPVSDEELPLIENQGGSIGDRLAMEGVAVSDPLDPTGASSELSTPSVRGSLFLLVISGDYVLDLVAMELHPVSQLVGDLFFSGFQGRGIAGALWRTGKAGRCRDATFYGAEWVDWS